MLNIIEPTHHHLYKDEVHTFLDLLKIYQNFDLSPEAQEKATFIVAEDERRGVYGGAVFFPKKIKELDEALCNLLSIQENRTIWCSCLCLCIEQDHDSSTLERIKLYEDFYKELYKILGALGKRHDTNCLPMKLYTQDYRNSLLFGDWTYFTKLKSEEVSDYVYVLLALPDCDNQAQIWTQKGQTEDQSLDIPVSANIDRPVR